MSPIIPSRYGHPKYNIFPQKSRASAVASGFKTTQRGTPGGDSKSRRKQRIEDSKITVQPTEDDDGDNFFSKQLAAARFQRNHRLINVLFSDIVVDQEPGSDADKLQACKKRVQSLTEYQRKIDHEMVELNERFNAKKAKIIDDGKKFTEKLTDFVVVSKKELEVLRSAQEVRRQQEAARRLIAKAEAAAIMQQNKIIATSVPNNNSSETNTIKQQIDSNKQKDVANLTNNNNIKINININSKETPMEVTFSEGGDSIKMQLKHEVSHVLETLLVSVANSVKLLSS